MAKEKSINQQRLEAGELQVGRKVGTTKVKKAIRKTDFERLIDFVSKNKYMNYPTKGKLKIAYTLLFCTGCRVSEIIEFTKDDLESIVKFEEISLDNKTKTGKPRLIKFSDEHLEMIKKVVPKESGFLFKKNNSIEPMTISGLTSLCNNYIQIALGELYSSHGFRRNMISTILRETGRVRVAQQHIGHTSPITTAKYDTLEDGELKDILNRVKW
ncbi:MAG: site-specific integrase [Arcobacteraceae bacterium]|jgi:integrase|nr:site-specific integrase [Arcobacteraceae bacterium]